MVGSFTEMFAIYFTALFVMLLVISGIDLYFNAKATIGYGTLLKSNFYTILFFIPILAFAFYVTYESFNFSDDTKSYLALSIAFIATYLVKSAFLAKYEVTLSYHFFVTTGTLILLFAPLYIIYKVLSDYGKGFMH